ncbi:hypothetical protein LA080_007318 [Diaporthe eres]|nr:hypothetical protein LA080_007318 [Diaporthe eres]
MGLTHIRGAQLATMALAPQSGGMTLANEALFWTYEAAGAAQQIKLVTKAAARIASQFLQKKLSFARDWYCEDCRKGRNGPD